MPVWKRKPLPALEGLDEVQNLFAPPPGLTVRFHRHQPSHEYDGYAAIMSFHGNMPDGSGGKAHGRFVASSAAFWRTHEDAKTLVVDFRDLRYRWGDSLIMLFDRIGRQFDHEWSDIGMQVPIKLLASDNSAGLYSLISDKSVFFDTIEDALISCRADMGRYYEDA
ncbi:hypothetical protein GCM10007854_18190 [Algimonas porphyrae]|uniref:STAS domain-containing protein n=2 Tax=Algimonas porphyrae TaxID=1128113 RepID=A0ABQ5V2D7_9PROT|nr:hypothetical protein GCM10007854_18190 [Algimonas porphyrae]